MTRTSLFTAPVACWADWGKVYQSIPAFTPLAEHVLRGEGLPALPLEHLTPGTNAVFRTGAYVLKIFAPTESGMDQTLDLQTELFAMRRAGRLGISAPKLVAEGFVEDKYRFAYMVTEYIEGIEFAQAVKTMTDGQKLAFGQKLRAVTDRMNTPCGPFNGIDAIRDKSRWTRWEAFPGRFRQERAAWLEAHDFGEFVFVHGDLCGDNILLAPQGEIYIIDFADALSAPRSYEHALLAVEFDFDPVVLRGYFGEEAPETLAERCFDGILIHDFGGDIVKHRIAPPGEIGCLEALRQRVYSKIKGAYA